MAGVRGSVPQVEAGGDLALRVGQKWHPQIARKHIRTSQGNLPAHRKEKGDPTYSGVSLREIGATMCAWLRPLLRGRITLQLVPRRVNINIGQVGISVALKGELVHDAVVSVCCQRVVCRARWH